jgi:hypothetical protein
MNLGDKKIFFKSLFLLLILQVLFFLLACTWLAGAGPLCLLPSSLLRRAAGQSQANLHGYLLQKIIFSAYLTWRVVDPDPLSCWIQYGSVFQTVDPDTDPVFS